MDRLNKPFIILAGRLFGVAMSLVSAPILARALGPDGRGMTAAAIATLTLLPVVVGLGLPLVVRRRATDEKGAAATIRTLRLLALAGLLPALGIGAAMAMFVFTAFTPQSVLVFVVACASTPFSVLWIANANVLIAERRLFAYATVSVFPGIVFLATVLVGVVAGLISVPYVIAMNLLGSIATFALTSVLVRVSLRGAYEAPKGLVREGASFAGSQLAEAASFRLDQVIALPIIGAAQAGYYAVAATIAMLPYAVGQAVGTAVFREVANADESRRPHLVSRAVRLSFIVALVSTAALAAVVPWAVPFIFGADFSPAVLPSLVALLGSVAVAVGYVTSTLLTALGKGWMMTIAQVSGLAVGVVSLFVLGPLLGAIGAAAASALGYLLTTITTTVATGARGRDLLPRGGDLRRAFRLVVHGKLT